GRRMGAVQPRRTNRPGSWRQSFSRRVLSDRSIAIELLLKIGIQISRRTVRRYMPKDPKRPKLPSQQWMTFVRNHAKTILAADKLINHDRDSIYSKKLDSSLRILGLRVLRTPYRSPQANAFCERLLGSARRECLNFMIPIYEDHVRWIMKQWAA